MYLKIGSPARDRDIVELLLDCHERIRSFLALAARLAAAAALSGVEVREAAERVRRYFAEALPLHAADEDDSIAPRLRGRSPEVDAALARMTAEHVDHQAHLAELTRLCEVLAREPEQHADLRHELAAVADTLHHELGAHLRHEEEVVFPAIRTLSAEDQQALVEELRRRRA